MSTDALPQRKPCRLREFDYSNPNAYSITICVHARALLFGIIAEGEMRHSAAGKMVIEWWKKIPEKFPHVELDEFAVMPNHMHGIIRIRDETPQPTRDSGGHAGPPLQSVVQWFKTMTTNAYIRGVKSFGWPRFENALWQRSFHDHIIRSEEDLFHHRSYIRNNPLQWTLDRENPDCLLPVEKKPVV